MTIGKAKRALRLALLGALSLAALGYLAVAGAIYSRQDKMLFYPVPGRFAGCPSLTDDDHPEVKPDFETVDARVDLAARGQERVRVYIRARPDARGWLIAFHGNAESACSALFYARQLDGEPLNFAVAEYPGYLPGKLPGNLPGSLNDADEPSSQAAFERNAEAVYSFVQSRNPVRLPVISFGRSLGTGVATYLASVRPVAGLVLISPYPSLVEVGSDRFPWLPVRWLMKNPFPADQWALDVHVPVLIVHGTADRVIPIRLGREQARNLGLGSQATMLEIPGGGHGSIVKEDSPAWNAIRAFTRQVLAKN